MRCHPDRKSLPVRPDPRETWFAMSPRRPAAATPLAAIRATSHPTASRDSTAVRVGLRRAGAVCIGIVWPGPPAIAPDGNQGRRPPVVRGVNTRRPVVVEWIAEAMGPGSGHVQGDREEGGGGQ